MRLRYKRIIVIFTLGIMLIGMGTFSMLTPQSRHSAEKETAVTTVSVNAEENTEKSESEIRLEITTLVKNYFDAKQRVDMTELAECVSDISHVEEKKLVTEAEYIEAYRNIDCTILEDGLPEGSYRVYVYYEVKIYDIDTLVPSLTALYVTTEANGNLTICLSAIDADAQDAIDALDATPQIQELISQVQDELNTIVEINDDVRDFYQMLESSDSEETEVEEVSAE